MLRSLSTILMLSKIQKQLTQKMLKQLHVYCTFETYLPIHIDKYALAFHLHEKKFERMILHIKSNSILLE